MNLLAWLTAAVAGWFWIRALWPGQPGLAAWVRVCRDAALSLAFGVGATGAVFFALLWAGMQPRSAAWTADGLVLAGGAAVWFLLRGRTPEQGAPEAAAPLPFAWLTALAAAGCLAAFLTTAVIYLRANPQGDWDAWAVWNLRAKFLAHEGMWRNAVSPELTETHPEYPLLWSSAVARVWAESGNLAQAAPQAGAFLTSLALVALFAAALAAAAGWQWMCLGLVSLLAAVPLWRSAPGQYADVPLALFLLGAILAAAAAERARWSAAALALSGAMASFAAFTKNEGLAFCVLLGAVLAAVARLRALWWLAGAAPVLALTFLFHHLLAPSKPLLTGAAFLHFGRLAEILQGLALAAWKFGELPAHPLLFVLALFFVFRPKRPWRPLWPAAAAVLLLAADVAVMWGSPNDAEWQVSTAADRLLLQVAPVLMVCAFWWLARAPEAATAAEVSSQPAQRKTRAASTAKD